MIKNKKKKSQWRNLQEKRLNKKKRNSLILGAFFLSFLGLLVFGSILVAQAKDSIWDGKSVINIIYEKEGVFELRSIEPSIKRMVRFVMPENTLIEAPFGFGEYQLKNIYGLGKLDNRGGELLTRAVQDSLGLIVKGYKVKQENNLTWLDSFRFWQFETFKIKKESAVNLAVEGGLYKEVLVDGQEVLRINQLIIDELINREIFDEKLAQEGLTIGVINGSLVDGVAKKVGRIVSNLGGDVRLVSNGDEQGVSKLVISGSKVKDSYTVKLLSTNLEIETIEVDESSEFRVDVVVIVGKDYTHFGRSDKI